MVLDALNDFPIYLLPIEKQKWFLFTINCMQNKQKPSIGPFAELNYETLTKVNIIHIFDCKSNVIFTF